MFSKIIYSDDRRWPVVTVEGPFDEAGAKLNLVNFANNFHKNLIGMAKLQRDATKDMREKGTTRLPSRFDAICALAFCPDEFKPQLEEYYRKKGVLK